MRTNVLMVHDSLFIESRRLTCVSVAAFIDLNSATRFHRQEIRLVACDSGPAILKDNGRQKMCVAGDCICDEERKKAYNNWFVNRMGHCSALHINMSARIGM